MVVYTEIRKTGQKQLWAKKTMFSLKFIGNIKKYVKEALGYEARLPRMPIVGVVESIIVHCLCTCVLVWVM